MLSLIINQYANEQRVSHKKESSQLKHNYPISQCLPEYYLGICQDGRIVTDVSCSQ